MGCLLEPTAWEHVFITMRSGQAMTGSSITSDIVPPHIQSAIDKSAKLLGMTTTSGETQYLGLV